MGDRVAAKQLVCAQADETGRITNDLCCCRTALWTFRPHCNACDACNQAGQKSYECTAWYVENVEEELDAAGEFYYDNSTGVLRRVRTTHRTASKPRGVHAWLEFSSTHSTFYRILFVLGSSALGFSMAFVEP